MAEKSLFWTTNGTGDGASNYTQAELTGWLRRTFIGSSPATQGVIRGYANELVPAAAGTTSAPTITIGTGAAVVYGFPYENDSQLTLSITKPVVNTTGGIVVLRVNWTAQTVRAILRMSADGVAALPTATQTANTTWEIVLCSFTVTTGGVVSLTDARTFAIYGSNHVKRSGDNMTGPLTIDGSTVWHSGNDGSGSGLDADTVDGIHGSNIALVGNVNNFVAGQLIAGWGIWTAGNDGTGSGMDADLLRGVSIEWNRRGGSASDWGVQGATNYGVSNVRVQLGAIQFTITNGNSYLNTSVTFPTPFAGTPLLFCTVQTAIFNGGLVVNGTASTTAAGIYVWRGPGTPASGDVTCTVSWVAIGPR